LQNNYNKFVLIKHIILDIMYYFRLFPKIFCSR